MFTYVENGETLIKPIYVDELSGQDCKFSLCFYIYDDQERIYLELYDDWYDEETGEYIEGNYHLKSELVPFESGDYEIVFYSLKNDITYGFAMGLKYAKYINYTLSKNIKYLKSNSFRYSDFIEIWYEGTMSEFDAINKEYAWKATNTLHTVHCKDGDLSV